MTCEIKDRVNTLLRDNVKERFPYIKEENSTTLSLTPKTGTKLDTKDKVFKAINDKIVELNNYYRVWANGDVLSVNSSLKDVVKVNIHPTQALIDIYEADEQRKEVEEQDFQDWYKNNQSDIATEEEHREFWKKCVKK